MTFPTHLGLVVVRWQDANFEPDQIDPSEVSPGMVCETTGFLLRRDNEWIVLAGELLSDGDVRATTSVPAAIVLEVIDLVPNAVPSITMAPVQGYTPEGSSYTITGDTVSRAGS